jgi:hypothetical protein
MDSTTSSKAVNADRQDSKEENPGSSSHEMGLEDCYAGWDLTGMMMPVPMAMMPMGYMQYDPSVVTSGVTTLMMKNLPNKVTRDLLLKHIDDAWFANSYDFVYLPIDPDTKANRGYAFINFVKSECAAMFANHFEGKMLRSYSSGKVIHITPAAIQGFDANYAFYHKLRVNQRDPEERPLFLRSITPDFRQTRSSERRHGKALLDSYTRSLLPAKPRYKTRAKLEEAGETAHPASPKNEAERPAKKPATKFCTECGEGGIEPHFKFCQHCGTPVVSHLDGDSD